MPDLRPVIINDKPIEVVPSVKLLGLNISNDLKWNFHISEISRKFSTRLYFIKQLKRAHVDTKDILSFYTICIRPIAEYASPVFHNSLTKYLSEELERLQKRAMKIIFPCRDYNDALSLAGLSTLYERRQVQTTKLFKDIKINKEHKLHKFLPNLNNSRHNLRKKRTFDVPHFKTNRLKNNFFYSNCQ